jgi:hypothetical protein
MVVCREAPDRRERALHCCRTSSEHTGDVWGGPEMRSVERAIVLSLCIDRLHHECDAICMHATL